MVIAHYFTDSGRGRFVVVSSGRTKLPQIGSLVVILGTIIWCGAFSYLSAQATDMIEWLSLVSIGLVSIATMAYWIYAHKQQNIYKQKLKLIHAGISTLTPAIEAAIFDDS